MHFRTHVSPEKMAEIKAVYPNADAYTAGMIEHDMHIGQFLALLDELGIAEPRVKGPLAALRWRKSNLARRAGHRLRNSGPGSPTAILRRRSDSRTPGARAA